MSNFISMISIDQILIVVAVFILIYSGHALTAFDSIKCDDKSREWDQYQRDRIEGKPVAIVEELLNMKKGDVIDASKMDDLFSLNGQVVPSSPAMTDIMDLPTPRRPAPSEDDADVARMEYASVQRAADLDYQTTLIRAQRVLDRLNHTGRML